MDDLLGDFVAETRETLEALAGEIVAWEAAPDDRSRLDAIFRFVHTVKGSCGFLDLPRLEKLSHAAEDVLADVRADRRRPDSKLVSAVLAMLDRIAELTDAIETGHVISDADDHLLIAALQPDAAADEPRDETDADLELSLAVEAALAIDPVEAAETVETVETAPVEAGPVTVASATPRAVSRTIRLPVDLLDRMMAGVSDMVLARNELARRLRDSGTESTTEVAFERLSLCIAEMRDAITRTRMARVEHLFTALPRMVRDVSAELGKQVQLEIDGGDVELDREMIEMIRDPLTHIVRNAIDHGIEAPEARILAGKPAAGRLHVSARQVGNQILIEIIDDGRGIDADKLVQKAVANGVISAERAASLSWDRKLELIFEPGLSTAQEVTAISGRGVGMDVVRANVERIGGLVDLDSRPGQGLRLTLRVPLTLTIIPALTISSGGQHFAIPRSAIDEIVRIGGDAVKMGTLGGADIVFIRGTRLPVVTLSNVIGLAEGGEPANLVVLKLSGGARYALAVEAVHDHEELVVKPAAPVVMACGIYGGTTLPDNSRPMLLLDVAGVAEKAGVRREEKGTADAVAEDVEDVMENEGAVPVLLFRDLDGVERGIPLALVERIEDCFSASISKTAGRARLNIDGRLVPLVTCGAPITDMKVRVLRMHDGNEELAYAIDSVIDIVPVTVDLQRSRVAGPVAGVMLVDERPVEFIDAFWLFAQGLGNDPTPAQRPVCLLSDEDPWTRQVLAPLVESAGYSVVFAQDEPGGVKADLVIMADGSAAGPVEAGAVVRLRPTSEERGASPESFWRYDRAGLTAELRRHWNKRGA
ncbi:chemotaxis protein CheA [Sphingomonas sp. Root710]|uniref:chemotaxis protein CheA n=1 Tax=Sphingomonas sp. Root710 TaxID=1736594 RepID=UPI0006FAA879|nr:chemotaxis protein CheA [Sphingomonas sp. Root710]KRB85736.1 chemotaxis protein CheA [Sphingomonas sp. Root710]